jgi:hypothetical protein
LCQCTHPRAPPPNNANEPTDTISQTKPRNGDRLFRLVMD